jgi:hypothetical protein
MENASTCVCSHRAWHSPLPMLLTAPHQLFSPDVQRQAARTLIARRTIRYLKLDQLTCLCKQLQPPRPKLLIWRLQPLYCQHPLMQNPWIMMHYRRILRHRFSHPPQPQTARQLAWCSAPSMQTRGSRAQWTKSLPQCCRASDAMLLPQLHIPATPAGKKQHQNVHGAQWTRIFARSISRRKSRLQ